MKLEEALFDYKYGKISLLPYYDRISGKFDHFIDFPEDENQIDLWVENGIADNLSIDHYYDWSDEASDYNEYEEDEYIEDNGVWAIMFFFFNGSISYHDRYNNNISREEFASKYPSILQKFESVIKSFKFIDGINHIEEKYNEYLFRDHSIPEEGDCFEEQNSDDEHNDVRYYRFHIKSPNQYYTDQIHIHNNWVESEKIISCSDIDRCDILPIYNVYELYNSGLKPMSKAKFQEIWDTVHLYNKLKKQVSDLADLIHKIYGS